MSSNESFSESTGQTVEVIGFGRRFVAYLIDSIVLSVMGCSIGWGIGLVAALLARGSEDAATGLNLSVQCLNFLITAAYFVMFWATTGQTLGKMATGIKVISTDGSSVSWGKALLRYIGYIVSSIPLALGFIWAAFDAKRQGWHDKIANTYVVRKDTHFSATDDITFVPSDAGSSAALVIVLVMIPMVLVLVAIVVIAILLLLGPVVGNVFSNIITNIQTPTP
jgi:uncharacterized RDD family membrane protein YckC